METSHAKDLSCDMLRRPDERAASWNRFGAGHDFARARNDTARASDAHAKTGDEKGDEKGDKKGVEGTSQADPSYEEE
jgi:hypothetical protein